MRRAAAVLFSAVVLALAAAGGFAVGWNAGVDHQHAADAASGGSETPFPAERPVSGDATAATPPEVLFSPRGGCTKRICEEIGRARYSIHIQAYGFTSEPIGGALVGALNRGVKVTACVDKASNGHEERTIADLIAAAGADVRVDGRHAISHSKVMIIDERTVITGSFNFTNSAEERNLENLLVLGSTDLAERYLENFEAHWQHAEPYDPGSVPAVRARSR
jgi:phosphatidylserine/phosphatidylglycerophosphate/cardiolipin synthase-like enzyme